MPKAEVGSTKYVANKMKAKGLQRLRWYCQICGKQCRDDNGFKQHTMSEGHVRAMLLVGEDPKKYINDYSKQFQRDFLHLLKTAHGEKKVHMNNFYQEYIRDKEHIHMNATKWPSLTEFAKHLGREGICRVEEGDRGLEIAWIDDSLDAIQRREDIRRKDRQAKGDEHLESRLLEAQVKRAREAAEKAGRLAEKQVPAPPQTSIESGVESQPTPLPPSEPIKVSLSLKSKQNDKAIAEQSTFTSPREPSTLADSTPHNVPQSASSSLDKPLLPNPASEQHSGTGPESTVPKVSLSLAAKNKQSNPLAKRNPFAKKKEAVAPLPEKKMSNAERIMREEMERKRLSQERHGGGKRQRVS